MKKQIRNTAARDPNTLQYSLSTWFVISAYSDIVRVVLFDLFSHFTSDR